MIIYVIHCKNADKDHKEYMRQYAHTFHKGNNVICVAREFFDLPDEHYYGLLAHEIGHILAGEKEKREYKADELVNKIFGIKIKYKDSIYGDWLQYLTELDTDRFIEGLKKEKIKLSN